MARTYRTPSISARRFYGKDKVRDGTFTHASSGCRNHGGCPYCLSNRTHFDRKHRVPIMEEDIIDGLYPSWYHDFEDTWFANFWDEEDYYENV